MTSIGLVSIVMPCFNSAQYVGAAIESLLFQTYSLWELLVVNDGSSDDTYDVIKSFSDPRIKLFSQSNRGVSAARNVGLDSVVGEFITFLDADDTLPNHSLECRVNFLNQHRNVSIVAGSINRCNSDMSHVLSIDQFTYQGFLLEPLARLSQSVFTLPFYMFRSSSLGNIRFNPSFSHCEDILFFLQISEYSGLFLNSIDLCVYNYRTGHPSAMSDMASMNSCLIRLNRYISSRNKISLLSKLISRFRIARIVSLQYASLGAYLMIPVSFIRVILAL